jgi:hypothetical protein
VYRSDKNKIQFTGGFVAIPKPLKFRINRWIYAEELLKLIYYQRKFLRAGKFYKQVENVAEVADLTDDGDAKVSPDFFNKFLTEKRFRFF